MMGQLQASQNALFYEFCLDKHIPQDHFLRQIDQFLDFDQLRQHLRPYYSHTGRPSIDPELMIRMLIIGYSYGIRSERRLCEEINFNLAYRWFCQLGLEDEVPNHSSFSKARHGRFRDSDLFRHIFEGIVQSCIDEGLVGSEGFATDASIIKADANRQKGVPGKDSVYELTRRLKTRAVREYLRSFDKEATESKPSKYISLTDPKANWTASVPGAAIYAYSTNYLVDVTNNVIVDVQASGAHRVQEVNATREMLERVEKNYSIKPKHLIGDTAYGSAPMLDWLVEHKHIEPHIPVWDKSVRKDGTFSVSDFTWEEENNRYRCPGGKYLYHLRQPRRKSNDGITKDNTRIFRAEKKKCDQCDLKEKCCANVPARKIARSIYESSRELARQIKKTERYRQSSYDRKKVEVLFAHLKHNLKLNSLRLRGIKSANDEFLLAATAQNLKRLAKLRYRPPDTIYGHGT